MVSWSVVKRFHWPHHHYHVIHPFLLLLLTHWLRPSFPVPPLTTNTNGPLCCDLRNLAIVVRFGEEEIWSSAAAVGLLVWSFSSRPFSSRSPSVVSIFLLPQNQFPSLHVDLSSFAAVSTYVCLWGAIIQPPALHMIWRSRPNKSRSCF